MDSELKTDIEVIKVSISGLCQKFDTYIQHQETLCNIKHKDIEEHLKESPAFRDKIHSISAKQSVILPILLLIVAGCVSGGIWWALRVTK